MYNKQKAKVSDIKDIQDKGLKKFADDSRAYVEAYGELMKSYKSIRQLLIDYQEMLTIARNPTLTKETYTKKQEYRMEEAYGRLKEAHEAIMDISEQLNQMHPLYVQLKSNPQLDGILNFGGRIKLYAYVESLKLNVDKLQKGFDTKRLEAIVEEMEQCILALQSDANYYMVSNPIQPKNDVVLFDVSIKRHADNESKLITERVFRHEEYIRKGIRIDLGLGLAGSFFPNVEMYDIVKSDSNAVISQTAKHTYIPSVIGLATLGFRSANYAMFGMSAGMGVDINEGEIQISNFYAGPSLTLGRYDRITIAGGVAIKNLNVLKNGYVQGEPYPVTMSLVDIMTKRYHVGGFLSLTYNLTRGMKDNIKYLKYIP